MGDERLYNTITREIIGAAIEVHRVLGPGLLESVYELCLKQELQERGLIVSNQVAFPLLYKGKAVGKTFVIDLLVENRVVVELKSVDALLPIHEVQLVTYLKLTGQKLGLLINFNVPQLSMGIKRKINGEL